MTTIKEEGRPRSVVMIVAVGKGGSFKRPGGEGGGRRAGQ